MKKLILILGFVFLLRVPSLFEPAWYGDEGIYLVVGRVIHQGGILYRDIWDNKTPLLYFLYGINPVLWWAKLMAMAFVLGSVVGVYKLAEKLKIPAATSALVVGILLSIPRFEGTIANGELFFILPIIMGAYLIFTNSRFWAVGVLAAVAFLIKVPSVFDFLGFFVFLMVIRRQIKDFYLITAGFLAPVILVLGYFYINGTLRDFITAAFLQNSKYVAVNSGPLAQLSNPLFIKTVLLLVSTLGLIFGYVKKYITRELLFLGLWFGFATFGALLSNRPYTHYLLQIIPPAMLLLSYLIVHVKKYLPILGVFLIIIYIINTDFKNSFRLNTVGYYKNFIDYSLNKKPGEDYSNFFDRNTSKTTLIAKYIRDITNSGDTIFVWDDASYIYYLSGRKPATKFIQAHHLTTVDPQNYESVISKLTRQPADLIAINSNLQFKFPKLEALVQKKYRYIKTVNGLKLYTKSLKD